MLCMAPIATIAIMGLQRVHLVAPSPIWVIPSILLVGQTVSTVVDLRWRRTPAWGWLQGRIAVQAVVVTLTIYATGWGPALAIGLVLVGQETLAVTGSSAQPSVLAWNLSCLLAGQLAIAAGWAPSLIPTPEVHGLAVLVGVGTAFAYRSLGSALVEKEHASALTERHERRFRSLVQSSNDLVFVVDAEAAVTYASPSCLTVLGRPPEVLLGSEAKDLVHEDDLPELRQSISGALEVPRGASEFAMRVRHTDGTWRWLAGIATNLLDDPSVAGLVINARDDTERHERVDRQAALADLGRWVLEESSLEVVFERAVEVIEAMIPSCACRLQESATRPSAVTSVSAGDSGAPGPALVRSHVVVGSPDEPAAVIELVTASGPRDEDIQFVESVAGLLLSVIVRFRAEDAMRHQATHDPLTGLPNRLLFNDRLEHALARRKRFGGFVAVLVVDLDEFKNVNDSLGHLTGDALLVALAARLRSRLRDVDTIARLGGDEFAILVDDVGTPPEPGAIAEAVLKAVADPLEVADRVVTIGVSIGLAVARRKATADLLLSHADAAMYRAKRDGKGCYRVFEETMHSAAVERMSLDQGLRTALAEGAVTVHYQPILEIDSGRVAGFEALARWHHPGRGAIPPSTFVPLAEESGLIAELGRSVLVQACRQAKTWQVLCPDRPPSLSVNVSRLQLAHAGFVEQVMEELERAALAPQHLTLEVTESVLARESLTVVTSLSRLRELGVRVAIDDFGTGYSSFAALAELPIDVLKIDKQFVDNLTRGQEGRGFVKAIMEIARTLDLETVAEGVEREEHLAELATLGCTHVQGYLLGRPMPGDHTQQLLRLQLAPS